ncbi:hypothetical protein F5Y00DRAFT_271665 [Daldinia vernicosa]|uniref:uncharacterized protein n=1 Tax=Daldinia vernicosa TaxID=114800 RepID=UPI002008A221|nr:uncharacterized protein F5Y00DRAFT_271665 [Daldinia vernicosa]KAI0853225.1 hypothetical protein F5Y00DRAFT_271665 [Daldinia vernicosa]
MATGPQAFYCLWQKEAIREKLFQLLSKEDICNVRLSSSACCNLVTKRLFLRTHLTFTSSTFTRQSRIEALSRVGQHIEHLTFYFPHSEATFLPPLVHPDTGREISFLYKPHTSMASVLERPKFANSGLGEILTQQYPPLFHAASNVPSFINAMKHLPNMRHLTIKTPGQDPKERYRRDIVDYALISLRISLERAPMRKLTKLSLSSVHPSAFIYLRHVIGFGCLPSAARRWKQIQKLNISVEAWDFYGPSPGLDHLKMIDDYIRDFSTSLEKLTFNWLGRKGPCPLSLAADPLFAPPRGSQKLFNEVTSPMSPLPPAPSRKPIVFRKLRFMAIRNATMNSSQVAELIAAHRHSVREFDFENVVLINDGSWDDALAPLLNKPSRSSRWTRQSMATITENAGPPSPELSDNFIDDLSGDSPAVSAASQKLLDVDLNGGEDEEEDESAEQNDEFDLPSDLEAARQASLSSPNKLKKRKVTKRRRRRKDKNESRDDDKHELHSRHHHRQPSKDSIDQPSDEHRRHRRHRHQKPQESFERQPEILGFDQSRRPSDEFLDYPHQPPHSSISPQSSQHRLFGEVESIYSTSSRRLFGEVSQLTNSGSEPELTHSPIDDSDSVVDEYFRPSTPTTTPMDISAPILSTAPSMPILLEPHVYDPTAELCSEITAVQRDIEAEEAQRRVAEDAELQTSALKRAKELVLSRLGREFSSGNSGFGKRGVAGPKKESFGAGSFLSSSRFREGLFGKSTPSTLAVIWPRARLQIANDAPLTRFLHSARGKPAWAFVAGAGQEPLAREMCFRLAACGFNIVLYGTGSGYPGGNVTAQKLLALRAGLLQAYPGNKYRVVVVDTDVQGDAVEGFAARVGESLEGANLTMLIDYIGGTDGMVLPQLKAVLMSLLKRNAPALVINVTSSMAGGDNGTQSCYSHRGSEYLSPDRVNVVSCHIDDVAVGYKEKSVFHRSTPRALAETVLLHAASSGRDAIVYPHWPQAILHMTRKTLLGMAMDQFLSVTRGDVVKR